MITIDIRCRQRETLVSKRDVREKKSTPQSDTTIISIAGERGTARER